MTRPSRHGKTLGLQPLVPCDDFEPGIIGRARCRGRQLRPHHGHRIPRRHIPPARHRGAGLRVLRARHRRSPEGGVRGRSHPRRGPRRAAGGGGAGGDRRSGHAALAELGEPGVNPGVAGTGGCGGRASARSGHPRVLRAGWRPRSSCVAFCCMCCLAASIASGITACWPMAHARPAWRWRASCCMRTRRKALQLAARRPQPRSLSPHHRPSLAGTAAKP
jgi:hypothetical protein